MRDEHFNLTLSFGFIPFGLLYYQIASNLHSCSFYLPFYCLMIRQREDTKHFDISGWNFSPQFVHHGKICTGETPNPGEGDAIVQLLLPPAQSIMAEAAVDLLPRTCFLLCWSNTGGRGAVSSPSLGTDCISPDRLVSHQLSCSWCWALSLEQVVWQHPQALCSVQGDARVLLPP